MPPKGRNPEDLNNLRLTSRQDYLAKREAESLILLRRQVAEEEEEERTNPRLSQAEKVRFAKNREVLRLADARNAIDEFRDGYSIPAADIQDKTSILNRRHDDKDKYISEVQLWENEQTSKANAATATQGKKSEGIREEDYEFVFDQSQEIKWERFEQIDPDKQMLQRMLDKAEEKATTMQETRRSLPVYQYRAEILAAIAEHQVLIVVGDTGSGKTTQLTQYLAEEGYDKRGKIGCTQPRRVAAMSVASRVADEFGCQLGQAVGYTVRFESRTSPKTVIEYLTDGMLLRCILQEPLLDSYSAIILDEAHERTQATDILMPMLKDLARVRPELRVIISSATMDAQKFSKYFDDAPIFSIPGRMYPVDIMYTQSPEADWLAAAITTIFQVHISQPPGDILVFLTGQEEIESAQQNIEDTAKKLGNRIQEMIVCPLYSQLPTDLQQAIFNPTPPKARKIVLSTNLAETSLTIPGIVYVIDSGFTKENVYNAQTGMESLVVVPASRASANQRAGRAGRTGPGKCFRLYTKYSYTTELPATQEPEILRSSLYGAVLQLQAMGVRNLLEFDWMDSPSSTSVIHSLERLYALGALNDKGELTKIGRSMSQLPLDPMLSKAILAADKYGCVEEVLSIIAMLPESGALFYRPKDQKVAADHARSRFTHKEGGDHLTLLRIYTEWVDSDYSISFCKENFLQQRSLTRARDVRDQLVKLTERVELNMSTVGISEHVPIRKAITAGFFPNAARLQRDGISYKSVKSGVQTFLHPSSTLSQTRPKWVVYFELVMTTKEYLRNCIEIEPAWLCEVAEHYYKPGDLDKLGVDKKLPKGKGKVGVS